MQARPPARDELEVSVFGHGTGECIVIHLGEGEWIIVDSCRQPQDEKPCALTYLEGLSVDIPFQVKLIVATHWHDDHIAGVADLLHACTAARFACSAALGHREFLDLVETYGQPCGTNESGAEEFRRILEICLTKQRLDPKSDRLCWAQKNTILFERRDPTHATVRSCSPSSATFAIAQARLGSLLPGAGRQQRRLIAQGPNDLSIVLSIDVAGIRLFLGADMEELKDAGRGWRAIVAADREGARHSFFKIPHHGSNNADNPMVWDDLLIKDPLCVVTTYNRGRKPLPSPADIRRIKGRTPRLYQCGALPSQKPPRRDAIVDKLIRSYAIDRRGIRKEMGHVRARVKIGQAVAPEDFTIELDGRARGL